MHQEQGWNISSQYLWKQDLEENVNAPDASCPTVRSALGTHSIYSQQQRFCIPRFPSRQSIFVKFPEYPADNREYLWFLMPSTERYGRVLCQAMESSKTLPEISKCSRSECPWAHCDGSTRAHPWHRDHWGEGELSPPNSLLPSKTPWFWNTPLTFKSLHLFVFNS